MDRELSERERVEREEFARGHIGPGEEPVSPRPAATMILARPGPDGSGMELLLLRRPDESRFAAGAYVFPGGVVDAADGDVPGWDAFGPEVEREERPALVAALRELFEETGLLPADEPPDADVLERARRELLADEVDFPSLMERFDLAFHGLRSVYLARWITPERLSRRYDARFFLAEHRGGEPELVADEHVASAWLEPAEALERFEAGQLPLLYPTWKTLEALAPEPSLEAVLERYRGRTVEAVRPRLLVEGERILPVLPGDPRYEEAGRGGGGEGEPPA